MEGESVSYSLHMILIDKQISQIMNMKLEVGCDIVLEKWAGNVRVVGEVKTRIHSIMNIG